MNQDRHDPLDAEERALAALLPRSRGRSEPTAEMDARILAAARVPISVSATVRRPRRWQVPVALAASLCLAVGLAWQLRQTASWHAQMDAMPAHTGHARPASAAPSVSVENRPATHTVPAQADSPRAPADALPAQPALDTARREAAPLRAMTAPEPAVPMTQAAPPMNEEQNAPAPPPPPPAPVAAPTPAAEVSAFPVEDDANKLTNNRDANTRSRVTAQESATNQAPASAAAAPRAFAAPAPAAPPPQSTAKRAALSAQGMGVVGQDVSEGENDEPPATMNSPGARSAWLRRISELANQGRTDEARASLAEFRKRYPNERIPAALRALENDPGN